MTNGSRTLASLFSAVVFLGLAAPVAAQTPQVGRPSQLVEGGPWLPPALRQPDTSPPSSGKALQEEVDHKLEKQFQRADVAKRGAITPDEAKTGRMGFVAAHFDEIDTAHRGSVTFEQVRSFLRERQAMF